MNRIQQAIVWLSRINHCRGFGIQSPTDYRFVRSVINEHWPYYQYDELGQDDDWLTQKLGRLYLRLANWRQPATIVSQTAHDYLHAGCRKATITADAVQADLIVAKPEASTEALFGKLNEQSVLVAERIWQHPQWWRQLMERQQSRVTFDLYYCGIILFDSQRDKQHYVINF